MKYLNILEEFNVKKDFWENFYIKWIFGFKLFCFEFRVVNCGKYILDICFVLGIG